MGWAMATGSAPGSARGWAPSLGSGLGDGLGEGGGGSGASADGVTVCWSKDGGGNAVGSLPSIATFMKSCQIAAGIVPPKTSGTPSTFSSGICPCGYPTHTQAAISTV